MMYRLPARPDEWIERARTVRFHFEGRAIEAFAGDTLTSALAAAGVMTTGRSFKYHRRRGLCSAANHDANNLFQIDSEPNQRGDWILARDAMQVSAVNTFGGVESDRASIIGKLAGFLPVGFYYKTGGHPWVFRWFERLVRHVSGLGRVDVTACGAPRTRRHVHCDVAVIGSGNSGLHAALEAARNDVSRVVLVEEDARIGGSALWDAPGERASLTRRLVEQVQREPRIQVITGHCVAGYYADHELLLAGVGQSDAGALLLRARAVVLATGAIEQPAVFRNNDLPGILLASAAQRLLHRYSVAPGRRIVILAGNASALEVAAQLQTSGVEIAGIALLQQGALDEAQRRALAEVCRTTLHDASPVEAHADRDGHLGAITFDTAEGRRRIDCDCLLLSTGWAPAQQLALQAGAMARYDAALCQFLPTALPQGLFIAGRARGIYDFGAKSRDGSRAGAAAAIHAGYRGDAGASAGSEEPQASQNPALPLFPHPRGKEFVDLDEDLTLADLTNAAQEGFDSIELLKRYSTVGMGPSQGKLSHVNAARQLSQKTGRSLSSIGLTTARPPYQPISLGALAGAHHSPLRRTPMDEWHEQQGARWMPAGNWRRPAFYSGHGLTEAEAIAGEVRCVRSAAGLIDVSTLGKIDVQGPDAANLLERLYTGRFADLAIGRSRYAVMLDEAGTIVDDGVVARLEATHFYVSTTTSASASVYREMQRRTIEWRLDCVLHNLTGHMAAMNLAGPSSRGILARCSAMPVEAASLPYQGVARGRIAGVEARVLRVGFVGELGFEIHVPADRALQVWEQLIDAGRVSGMRPFGVEAQRVLRLEKGHVIVGQDTDGLTNPLEAGLAWIVKREKPFFVGQRSLDILERRGNRQQLAGFVLESRDAPVLESHLVIAHGDIVGRVTSIALSPSLDQRIGLAFVPPSMASPGTSLEITGEDRQRYRATIVASPFYDPKGLRQNPPGDA